MRIGHAVVVMAVGLICYPNDGRGDQLGDCLHPAAHPDAVNRACSDALKHGGPSKSVRSRAYTQRGVARHRKKLYALALADHDHAIRLDPTNAEAYANRGAAGIDLAIELTVGAVPSWALIEDAMDAAKRAAADHRKALSLALTKGTVHHPQRLDTER